MDVDVPLSLYQGLGLFVAQRGFATDGAGEVAIDFDL